MYPMDFLQNPVLVSPLHPCPGLCVWKKPFNGTFKNNYILSGLRCSYEHMDIIPTHTFEFGVQYSTLQANLAKGIAVDISTKPSRATTCRFRSWCNHFPDKIQFPSKDTAFLPHLECITLCQHSLFNQQKQLLERSRYLSVWISTPCNMVHNAIHDDTIHFQRIAAPNINQVIPTLLKSIGAWNTGFVQFQHFQGLFIN